MNAFEQLQHLQIEPHHAFEEVVATIVRATEPDTRRVRVHQGDGGVDVGKGVWGETGALSVYQIKYFPNSLASSQRAQIRESFNTALENPLFTLQKWILCLPGRLSKADLHWFDTWAASVDVPIELIDGDDLTDLLDRPECSRARQLLRDFGVVGMVEGRALLVPEIRPQKLADNSGLSYALQLSLVNRGDRTGRGISLTIKHTENHRVAYRHDEGWWESVAEGPMGMVTMNPRRLRAVRPINPGEEAMLLPIGFPSEVSPPIHVIFTITAEDMPLQTWQAVVTQRDIDTRAVVRAVSADERDSISPSAVGSRPIGEAAKILLDLILAFSDRDSRGVSWIHRDLGDPTMATFFASIAGGSNDIKQMKKRVFEGAIRELMSLGWILEPEEGSGRTVFEINPDMNP